MSVLMTYMYYVVDNCFFKNGVSRKFVKKLKTKWQIKKIVGCVVKPITQQMRKKKKGS